MLNWSNTRVIARLKQTKPRRTESELLLRKRQQGKGHTYSALAEYCVVLLVVLLHQSFYDFDYTICKFCQFKRIFQNLYVSDFLFPLLSFDDVTEN